MLKIKIQGMSCHHCVDAVTRALQATPGVTKVIEVDLQRGEASVEGTPDPAALTRAVEVAGYRAEVIA